MELIGVAALFQAVIIVLALIISGLAISNIVFNHIFRSKYCRPSAMVYIYVLDAGIFVILGLGYGGYLIALWSPDENKYNAIILYWTGYAAGAILSTRQIGVFYLGIERIITILWPIDSQIVRLQMSFILCTLCCCSQLTVIVIGSGIVSFDSPNFVGTLCRASSCLMSTGRLSVYLYFRVIWSTVNFFIGISLCLILRRTETSQKVRKETTRLSTKVAVTTFFSSFVFDFLPHVTVQILYQTLRNGILNNIGPYSIFFGSLDVVISILFCNHSFRQQRKKVDRKIKYSQQYHHQQQREQQLQKETIN